jgi:hypothetical protein
LGGIISCAGITSFSQGADSLGLKGKSEQTSKRKGDPAVDKQYENNKNQANKQQMGANINGGKHKGIKQVKGARPDMSRARGARPPSIVRQSGSGLPRGMGKPGGAKRYGGR